MNTAGTDTFAERHVMNYVECDLAIGLTLAQRRRERVIAARRGRHVLGRLLHRH